MLHGRSIVDKQSTVVNLAKPMIKDIVDHPKHYASPSEIGLPILKVLLGDFDADLCIYTIHEFECIDVEEWIEDEWGWQSAPIKAFEYLWRAGQKEDAIADLEKAKWYLNRSIKKKRIGPTATTIYDTIQMIDATISREAGKELVAQAQEWGMYDL